jgi:hypothetical protein
MHNEVIDASCCCGEAVSCNECDVTPTSVTVQFTADLNAYSPGTGCAHGCSDWISAFDLPMLTQAQIDYMVATWPGTWPQTEPVPRQAGCYFGLFSGLPCDATSMVLQIVAGGRSGLAVATVTIGWADGIYAEITCTHLIDPASGDCCGNLTANMGDPNWTIGLNASAGCPCDFALVAEGLAADMNLTANC